MRGHTTTCSAITSKRFYGSEERGEQDADQVEISDGAAKANGLVQLGVCFWVWAHGKHGKKGAPFMHDQPKEHAE